MPARVLEARGLVRAYAQGGVRVPVLDGLDVTLAAGERLALTGPSGSGKSTLLNLLAGLDLPDAGTVRWWTPEGAVALEALGESARTAFRRTRLGFVFQAFDLLPTLTALENVAFMAELAGRDAPRDRAAGLLDRLGLGNRRDALPETLSGGEQQRVAIARALVHEPAAVLADEPTGNLDAATGARVFEALSEALDRTGAALVLVTHDASLASRVGARLDLGRTAAA